MMFLLRNATNVQSSAPNLFLTTALVYTRIDAAIVIIDTTTVWNTIEFFKSLLTSARPSGKVLKGAILRSKW